MHQIRACIMKQKHPKTSLEPSMLNNSHKKLLTSTWLHASQICLEQENKCSIHGQCPIVPKVPPAFISSPSKAASICARQGQLGILRVGLAVISSPSCCFKLFSTFWREGEKGRESTQYSFSHFGKAASLSRSFLCCAKKAEINPSPLFSKCSLPWKK